MAYLFLTIYTVLLLIRPQEWEFLGIGNLPIVQFTLIGCLAAYPFVENKNINTPQVPLMVFFTLTLIVSVVIGVGWIGGAVALGQEFLQQSFIPFMLICGVVDTLKKQYVIFFIIVSSALFMVVNGYIQFTSEDGIGFVGNYIIEAQGARRITYLGILSDPNDLGMFLVMSIPIVFLLKSRASFLMRAFYWFVLAAILGGIYMTNSRGTLLATMALFGFWYWRTYGTTKTFFASLVASPVFLVVMSQFREIDVEEAGAQGRIDAWYAGYQMFRSNPIIGVGHRQFTEHHVETAHNSFVLVFSEMGLVGCVIWVAILLSTVVILYQISEKKFLREESQSNSKFAEMVDQESLIATTLLYSFLAFAVSGFFLSRSYIPILYIYIGMAVATAGRVKINFPKDVIPFDMRKVMTNSVYVTLVGIVGVYVLVRIGL